MMDARQGMATAGLNINTGQVELFAGLVPEGEAAGPASGRIVAGEPMATVWSLYGRGDDRVQAGRWRCTPGRWRVSYDETEYCRIIEGAGAVIDADGGRTPIAAGDEFVVPAGFAGEWEVTETMTKTYVVVLP